MENFLDAVQLKIAYAKQLYSSEGRTVPEDHERSFARFESDALEAEDEDAARTIYLDAGLVDVFRAVANEFRGKRRAEVLATRAAYEAIQISCSATSAALGICENCRSQMVLLRQQAMYVCGCGWQTSSGHAPPESQEISRHSQRHSPTSYFRSTLDHILGVYENKAEFPQAILEAILAYLGRKRLNLRNSRHYAYHLRQIMRVLKSSDPALASITKFDRYTSYIFLKLYPDYSMPQISADEHDTLLRCFNMIVEYYRESASLTRNYIRSYPYIIYKLIEILYPEKTELLKFIFIQKPATFTRNDELFRPLFRRALPQKPFPITPIDVYDR